ncbi:MAG: thioesterase domain-containing protein [Pseudorhodoplanes sp.]
MIFVRAKRFACHAALAVAVGSSAVGSVHAMPPVIKMAPTAGSDVLLVQARTNQNTDAQIFFVRGLAHVFSRGMDEMAAKLRAQGFNPQVVGHRQWQATADTIAQAYRSGQTAPIILVGHSLGANNAARMATRLQGKGVPVAYLATFDPTQTFTVPGNVRYFANFYQNNGFGRRASFAPSRHKEKVNLNLTSSPGLNHRNIDQSRRLHDIVIARVLAITAR